MAKLKDTRVYGNLTIDDVLLVSTDATITGNLTVLGTTTTVNSTTVTVEGPIVQQGAGANGAALTNNDGKDRGLDLSYYNGTYKQAFMGWNTGNSEFRLASEATIASDIVTFTTYGNLRANVYFGDGGGLSNINGSNVTGNVALSNNSNYAGNVTGATQTNITLLGTQTSLTVSGDSNIANLNANGVVNITNTTGSTSDTTGALKVAGGAGVVGNLYVGGTIYGNIAGTTSAPGSDTDVVFNDSNKSNATGGFTFNKNTNTVTIGSNITLSGDDGVANIGGNINLGGSSLVDNNSIGIELNSGNVSRLNYADNAYATVNSAGVSLTAGYTSPGSGYHANLYTGNGQFAVSNTFSAAGGNLTVDQNGNVNAAGYGSFANIYDTGLSNTQIVFPDNTGKLGGSAGLTYASNTLSANNFATTNANIQGNITTSNKSGNLLVANASTGNIEDSNVSMSGGTLAVTNANVTGNLKTANLQVTSFTTTGGIPVADASGNLSTSSGLTYGSNTLSANNITTAGTANVANLVVTSLTNNEIPFANATSGISGDASFTYTAGTGTFNAPNITANSNITTTTGTISGANIVDTNLTNTEVVFSGTGGKLQGDAGFTFAAGTLTANTMNAVVSLSSGNIYDTDLNLSSVVFAGMGGLLTQDSGFEYYTSNSTLTANNISANTTITAQTVLAANIGNATSYLNGNGFNITSMNGANVTGTVANANYSLYAGTVLTNAQPNITSVGTLTSLAVANSGLGNITADNANLGNLVTANYVAGTLTTAAQPNITSLGNLTSLTSNGNISISNVGSAGILTDYIYHANGVAWDFLKAAGSNTYIQYSNGTDLAASSNFTFDNSTQTLTVGGAGIANVTTLNATTGNITTVNSTNLNATGNIVSSGGSVHANVNVVADGNVTAGNTVTTVDLVATGNANVTGYLKAGDTTIAGNLVVTGTTTSVNTTTTQLEDPLIDLGLGANGAALTSDDGKDRGMVLHTYNGSNSAHNDIFMGWKDSLGAFVLAQNVTVTSSVVDYGTGNTAQQANLADLHLGNVYAFNANFGGVVFSNGNVNLGTGSYLNGDVHGNISGNIKVAGANGSIQYASNVTEHLGTDITAGNFVVGHYYKIDVPGTTNFTLIGATNSSSGTYFTATGVGAGTGTAKESLTYGDLANDGANLEYVGGNLSVAYNNGGYVLTDHVVGTIETAAQPNITSVGTLGNLSVTSNVSAGNVKTDNLLHADGTPWDFATAAGSSTQIQFSNGTDLAASANLTFDTSTNNLTVGGNIITGTGSGGNISGANNVTANYFIGDGSQLANITGGNVVGQVGNANIASTVYTNAQPNITSVGTLTSLTVANSGAGNVVADNVLVVSGGQIGNSGAYLYGDGTNISNVTAAHVDGNNITGTTLNPNIVTSNLTSVGNLTSLTVVGDITSTTGNIVAANIGNASTYLYGNGINISNIAGANVSGYVANANVANVAGYVTGNAQSNITSVGTLTSLTANGNITTTMGDVIVTVGDVYANSGTVVATYLQGTLTTAAQPNITSVGTLTSLAVTANLSLIHI